MNKTFEINIDAFESACDAMYKIGKNFHYQLERTNQVLSERLEPLENMTQVLSETLEPLKLIRIENVNKQLRQMLKTPENKSFSPKD